MIRSRLTKLYSSFFETGLQSIVVSVPASIPYFTPGERQKVYFSVDTSCCTGTVSVIATDSRNNVNSQIYDVGDGKNFFVR